MTYKLSARKRGIGSVFRADLPVYIYNSDSEGVPLDAEIQLGKALISSALRSGSAVDIFIVGSSLPRAHRALLPATLAKDTEIAVSNILEIGGSCVSALEALYYMFCTLSESDRALLLVVDSFRSSYHAFSAGDKWVDGGAAVLADPNGLFELELLAYVTAFDSDYLVSAHPVGGEIGVPFSPTAVHEFSKADSQAIKSVVLAALKQCGLSLRQIDAVLTTNRSAAGALRVKEVLGIDRIGQSRETNSHAGGADLLSNLSMLLVNVETARVVLLGFGLGYSWQAMVLRINRQSNA